nr:FAD-binding oxidoreductase [uncultured Holophaga sp.]
MERFDLVVVGAGIGGGSLVFNLLDRGFRGRILVVDREDSVGAGCTGRSAGGFRNLWTTPVNQRLCTQSAAILRDFKEAMGCGIGFNPSGYLFTYGSESWQRVPEAAAIWRENGVRFELLDPQGIQERIPGIRCEVEEVDPEVREILGLQPLVGGVFGPDCGSFDPSQAAQGYFDRALDRFSLKPELRLRTEVESLVFGSGGRIEGLRLGPRDEFVAAGAIALCTGPWTNELLRRSGCPAEELLPLISQKRMLFVTAFPDADPRWRTIPLTIVDQGIYFKAEGENLLLGRAGKDTPDSLDTSFEPDYYLEEVNLLLQERIPAVANCRLKSGWAGLYDTCTADHNAILGWHDPHPGLLLQVGYSGHGAMECPAAGICLAELFMDGQSRTHDITPRFREGALVRERIVI